jgi:tRNA(Ile)-lysidine synthase
MASSRKRSPKLEPVEQALLASVASAVDLAVELANESAYERALGADDAGRPATPARGASSKKPRKPSAAPLVIALSGGRDSSVLLDLAVQLRDARTRGFAQIAAVHVHHGMQAAADRWVEHCEHVCAAHGVPLDVRRVAVQTRGRGPEAAARAARYAALLDAARALDARLILTAHHLDDRIETFLIQWLRGAGPEGLAGMPVQRELEDDGPESDTSSDAAPNAGVVHILRPLLDISRADIERYVELRHIEYVDDPSNADPRVLRSSLRLHVLPALKAARPGFARAAARSIDLLAEAAETLREVSAADLAHCTEDAPAGMLRLDRLRQLTPARQTGVLRAWLASHQVTAPPRARLLDLLTQAQHARSDARLRLRVGTRSVRRYKGLLLLREDARAAGDATTVAWSGEAEIAVPAWRGTLRFIATEQQGFDAAWLQAQPLELRKRTGGERFKPHPTRPSKRLKHLFQEAGIAEFERADLPLVWRGDELIYVAGLGADVRWLDDGGERVRLEWIPDRGLSIEA